MTTATEGLLAALRRHTNRPTLTWSSPPAPLAGGFWAEMYIIELADPPNELDGRLVARIMPDPDTAAFETSVQRHLTHCGFPVPTIRCGGGPSSELDRAWSVMEFAAGQPPLAGLSAATALKQAPILLVDDDHWTLIDWSNAVIADPHYDLAFTTLMLANPPLGGPAPIRAATRAIGNRIANRFLQSYEKRTAQPVDPARLAWGRHAHALRALVEIATWEANDELAAHSGHPWLTIRPVLEMQLEPARRRWSRRVRSPQPGRRE